MMCQVWFQAAGEEGGGHAAGLGEEGPAEGATPSANEGQTAGVEDGEQPVGVRGNGQVEGTSPQHLAAAFVLRQMLAVGVGSVGGSSFSILNPIC